MSDTNITQEQVFALLQSVEAFPVDFNIAWEWLEYSRKDNAKRMLVDNFEEGLDFSSTMRSVTTTGVSTTRREDIMLTVDCFKSMGMMAGTAKGKEIRKYFLECERQLKELKNSVLEAEKTKNVLSSRKNLALPVKFNRFKEVSLPQVKNASFGELIDALHNQKVEISAQKQKLLKELNRINQYTIKLNEYSAQLDFALKAIDDSIILQTGIYYDIEDKYKAISRIQEKKNAFAKNIMIIEDVINYDIDLEF